MIIVDDLAKTIFLISYRFVILHIIAMMFFPVQG